MEFQPNFSYGEKKCWWDVLWYGSIWVIDVVCNYGTVELNIYNSDSDGKWECPAQVSIGVFNAHLLIILLFLIQDIVFIYVYVSLLDMWIQVKCSMLFYWYSLLVSAIMIKAFYTTWMLTKWPLSDCPWYVRSFCISSVLNKCPWDAGLGYRRNFNLVSIVSADILALNNGWTLKVTDDEFVYDF